MIIKTMAPSNRITSGATEALLKKYATQLTAVLGVVISVTGVMMFFSIYKHEVEAMHEWLGMAFVVAVILHLTRHRKPLTMILTQNRMRVMMLLTGLVAAAFIAFSSTKEGNPVKQTISAVLRAPIRDVAPVLGVSPEEAIARLTAAGARDAKPGQSIEAVANANQAEPVKLLMAVVGKAQKRE